MCIADDSTTHARSWLFMRGTYPMARTDGRARAAGLTIALEDIMAKVGFIGLGNMGMPMAENLLKAAYEVTGFDLNADATERLAHKGASRANSLPDACNAAEPIIPLLPAGAHVRRASPQTSSRPPTSPPGPI